MPRRRFGRTWSSSWPSALLRRRLPPPDGESEKPDDSCSQTSRTHVAPQSLARLSARQILDGYRAGDFTPRDVIDEVIVALESTDALCKVIDDGHVRIGSSRSRSCRRGMEGW